MDEEKLSSQGKDWLIASLDPFHDKQLDNLQGWPDLESSASLVCCGTASVQLAVPSATGVWDVVIQLNPAMQNRTMPVYNRNDDLFTTSTGVTQQSGLVTMRTYYGAARDGLYDLTDAPSAFTHMGVDSAFLEGKGRLIGVAFEVTNTSPELYKSGTITSYRVPQESSTNTRRLTTTGAAPVALPFTGRESLFQPRSMSDALLMEGSRQWAAKDGAYVVGAFNGLENPPSDPEYVQPIFLPANSTTITGGNLNACAVNLPFNALTSDRLCYWNATRHANINSSGVFITGLTEQSTLTVTLRYYYERFPSVSEPAFAVLARPSAHFDPVALQMYLQALQSMPIAVPVGDNAFGDWFAGLVSEFAPMIGNALGAAGIPGASVLGTGAKFLADRYLASDRPQKVSAKRAPPARKTVVDQTTPQQRQKKKKKQNKKKPPPGFRYINVDGKTIMTPSGSGW